MKQYARSTTVHMACAASFDIPMIAHTSRGSTFPTHTNANITGTNIREAKSTGMRRR